MNEKRLAVVKHAWTSLDESRTGKISWGKLQTAYRADEHPRVKTREKKSESVRAEYLETMGKRQQGGVVTEEGFIQYYADVNATLPAEKDDYFVELVLKTWDLASTRSSSVTAERLTELEDIVFEKIRQRTHGADDEGKTAKKIFKHFDSEIEALFRRFDANGNGKVDYIEFASFVARKGSGNNPNVNPVFGVTREPPGQVIDKILVVLKARGVHGIRGLGIVFRRMDNSGDRKLDRNEFQWGLKENGHVLSPSEFERIFKYFDKNNDGKIDYDEFLRAIRGDLNERRRSLIKLAY